MCEKNCFKPYHAKHRWIVIDVVNGDRNRHVRVTCRQPAVGCAHCEADLRKHFAIEMFRSPNRTRVTVNKKIATLLHIVGDDGVSHAAVRTGIFVCSMNLEKKNFYYVCTPQTKVVIYGLIPKKLLKPVNLKVTPTFRNTTMAISAFNTVCAWPSFFRHDGNVTGSVCNAVIGLRKSSTFFQFAEDCAFLTRCQSRQMQQNNPFCFSNKQIAWVAPPTLDLHSIHHVASKATTVSNCTSTIWWPTLVVSSKFTL